MTFQVAYKQCTRPQSTADIQRPQKFVRPLQPAVDGQPDVLALVGDIGSPYDPKLEAFLAWCSQNFHHVIYIMGNHEGAFFGLLCVSLECVRALDIAARRNACTTACTCTFCSSCAVVLVRRCSAHHKPAFKDASVDIKF